MYYKIIRLDEDINNFFYNIRVIDKRDIEILKKDSLYFSPALKFLMSAENNSIPGKNDSHEGLFARVINQTKKCEKIQNFLYSIFGENNIYEKFDGIYKEFYIIPHLCYYIACCLSPDVTYSEVKNGKVYAIGDIDKKYFMDFTSKERLEGEVKLENYHIVNYDYSHNLPFAKKNIKKNENYDLLIVKKVEYVDLSGEWIVPEYTNKKYDGIPYELFYKDKSISYQQEQRIVNIPIEKYKHLQRYAAGNSNRLLDYEYYYPMMNNGKKYNSNIDKKALEEKNPIVSKYYNNPLVIYFPNECMEVNNIENNPFNSEKLKIVFELYTIKNSYK